MDPTADINVRSEIGFEFRFFGFSLCHRLQITETIPIKNMMDFIIIIIDMLLYEMIPPSLTSRIDSGANYSVFYSRSLHLKLNLNKCIKYARIIFNMKMINVNLIPLCFSFVSFIWDFFSVFICSFHSFIAFCQFQYICLFIEAAGNNK